MSDLSSQVSADYSKLIREQTRQVDIDSFRERGMTKVNVINAKKINELIERAVGSVIARMEHASVQQLKDDKSKVIEDTLVEFKKLTRELAQKDEASKSGPSEVEKMRSEFSEALAEHMRELKAWHNNAQAKVQHDLMTRDQAAAEERKQLAASLELLRKQFADSSAQVASAVATLAEQTKAMASAPAPTVSADAIRDAIMPTLTSSISVAVKRSSEAGQQLANTAASDAAKQAAEASQAGMQAAVADAMAAVGWQVTEGLEKLSKALSEGLAAQGRTLAEIPVAVRAASEEAKASGAGVNSSVNAALAEQGKRLAELTSGMDSRIEAIGGQVSALAGEFSASRQDTTSIKAGFTALAGAVASSREDAKAMRLEVAQALAKPPGVDASQLQAVISGAVETAQRDLLDRLERQGVVKAGSAVGSADAAVASAVVRSAFRDLDSGTSEIQMDGVIRKQETAKGDAAQTALDKLRKMRGGQ